MSLLIISVTPVFIIAFYIYFRDKYEKEPWELLSKAIISGALITIPIIFIELLLSHFKIIFKGLTLAFYEAFIIAALTEESFKYFIFRILIWRNKEFDEKFDGIVYAVFISLGFALIENIKYVTGIGLSTGFIRAITAVPGHALFGVVMGYHFSIARFYPGKRRNQLILALLHPIALHGLYDFLLMSKHPVGLIIFIPYLIYLWRYGFKKMKEVSI